MLKYFYITKDPKIAQIVQSAGADRIFVDMEYIGKDKRQGGLDTVQNHHTVDDVKALRKVVTTSELLVRVNPIHKNSFDEINDVINAGADVIMLPMWKNVDDVKTFISIVAGRAKTLLLLETAEAIDCLDDVLLLNGIDEIHIGLNDLHLSQNKTFMFELFIDGTVDNIVNKIKKYNIPFGIGGVGKVNTNNLLSAENILCEHYRLGSSMVILARAFCDSSKYNDYSEFENVFSSGVEENREYEKTLMSKDKAFFDIKHIETTNIIEQIVSKK